MGKKLSQEIKRKGKGRDMSVPRNWLLH